ncbi:MAG: tryptophan synthase subunit alpha [Rhodothalassiaceae bacterium]
MSGRIGARFAELRSAGRGGLVAFVTAGDPDLATSEAVLARLPEAGADLIELGIAFTDPMADGPAIQEANQRALRAGITLRRTLDMVERFRRDDDTTPIVLMGYVNPVLSFGIEAFVDRAAGVGVDGLILVDLPPEEDAELRLPARAAGLDLVRLATPTTDARRLPRVLDGASGFLYYVSVAGITGTKSALDADIAAAVGRLRAATRLPLAVGFGIRTPAQAAAVARHADAAVVGSAIIGEIAAHSDAEGRPQEGLVDAVAAFVQDLSRAVHGAREDKAP